MRGTARRWASLHCAAILTICAGLAACSTDNISSSGGSAQAQRLRDSLVVSAPLTPGYSLASGPARAAASVVDSQLAYISLPPGTLDGADSVRIGSAGSATSERMVDGGFDPIAVYSHTADSLSIAVFQGGQEIGPIRVGVPSARPPTVVRTSPPKGRRDIPLNQLIVIVFSQPIDPATVTSSSVQLTVGGTPVAATLSVQLNQPWVVRIAPSALLAPSTTYHIMVDGTIKDASGLAITAPVNNDFTTGTSADSVASVAVFAVGGFARRPSSVAVATPGGTVQFLAYKISAAGDTLTPTSGPPISWSTSDATAATVDANGLVKAVAAGGANISACSGVICGQGSIVVDVLLPGITPTPLGDLGGGDSRVYGMKGGYVTGYSKLVSNVSGTQCRHAFLWSALRGMEDLGTLSGDCNSYAWQVNASGTVLGNSESRNFIWKRVTGMVSLADPDALNGYWSANKLNDNGDIAFTSSTGNVFAFSSVATGMHVYPAPAPGIYVGGLNNTGQLALAISINDPITSTYGTAAYIVSGATGQVTTTLRPVDSSGQPLTISVADMNDQGVVSGSVGWPTNETAFRWSPTGGFTYLASPGPGITTRAEMLNSAGDLTVYLISYRHIGTDSLFEGRSAVWMANGTLVMLGGLGGTHTFANGINDNHQAAGHSQVGSNTGPQQAVIWNLTGGAVAIQPQRIPGAARITTHDVSPPKRPRTRQPAIQ